MDRDPNMICSGTTMDVGVGPAEDESNHHSLLVRASADLSHWCMRAMEQVLRCMGECKEPIFEFLMFWREFCRPGLSRGGGFLICNRILCSSRKTLLLHHIVSFNYWVSQFQPARTLYGESPSWIVILG